LPRTPPKTLAKTREKRPKVPSAVASVAAASLPLRAAGWGVAVVGDMIWRGWLLLRTAGALFSSLNWSSSVSMATFFHSSSGGGRMELVVFVCS
jgi:hypothetical protein